MPSSLSMLPRLFLDSAFCGEEEQKEIRRQKKKKTISVDFLALSEAIFPAACPLKVQKVQSQSHLVCSYREETLFLFKYRLGEACLEEMHPGKTEAGDKRRKGASAGHRKKPETESGGYKRDIYRGKEN